MEAGTADPLMALAGSAEVSKQERVSEKSEMKRKEMINRRAIIMWAIVLALVNLGVCALSYYFIEGKGGALFLTMMQSVLSGVFSPLLLARL